jgi:low temperature requirement protein LtrA
MRARDPSEAHRVATPLELLFDLCFVVAVAQVSSRLHHGLSEAHYAEAMLAYVLAFFAIWWAWMNFTWFASAYDPDDTPYRLAVLVQIAGVLVLAAGVPRAFDERDYSIVTLGYTIMRVALVGHWLRAAASDPRHRRTALRYAVGIVACQTAWLCLLILPGTWRVGLFVVLASMELLVPVWAERANPTPWHPHHIAERYGLFTIIVLGESVLSATLAMQAAIGDGRVTLPLLGLIVGGLLTLFSMWWIYFDQPAHRLLISSRIAFLWGYGHLLIFAATAAVGAGLAASADVIMGRSHASPVAIGASVAVPVVLFVLAVWVLQSRPGRGGRGGSWAFVVVSILILGVTALPWAVLCIGLLLSTLVAVCVTSRSSSPHR